MHLATTGFPGTLLAIGWPEDGLTKDQAELLFVGGAVVCGLAVIFVLRQMKNVTTRLLWTGILVALAGFMVWQHQEVQDCAGQCSCELLGRDLAIRDEHAFCPTD